MIEMTGRDVADAFKLLAGPAGTYLRLRLLPQGQFDEQNAKTYVVRRQEGQKDANGVQFVKPQPLAIDDNLAWCISGERHAFRSAFTGQPVAFLQTTDINNIGCCAISPDQQKFAVVATLRADDSQIGVEVFDIATQDRVAYIPFVEDSFYAIAFAPDNNRVLVAAWDSVEIVDIAKQEVTGRLDLGWKRAPAGGHAEVQAAQGVHAFQAVPPGRCRAGGGRPGRSARTKSPRWLAPSIGGTSRNFLEEVVATGDPSGRVKLWDLNSGVLLQELPQNPEDNVIDVRFSPDGKWLAYLVKGILHVVDVSGVQCPAPDESVQAQGQTTATTPPAPKDAKDFIPIAGAEVEVHSRGQWYPAVIVREDGDGRWQIHYKDSPDKWDELVTLPRLRPRSNP